MYLKCSSDEVQDDRHMQIQTHLGIYTLVRIWEVKPKRNALKESCRHGTWILGSGNMRLLADPHLSCMAAWLHGLQHGTFTATGHRRPATDLHRCFHPVRRIVNRQVRVAEQSGIESDYHR